MERCEIEWAGMRMDLCRLDTLIVGSGAAGLNAADRLAAAGVRDFAILTEGLDKGTSRNTGSDKQTYYKLDLSGANRDSAHDMAATLFAGGAMHGDIALVQAALSPLCFARLVDIGVPFPHNAYGEYIGYQTDHDRTTRATSAGPLTSQWMTRCLAREVAKRGIPIWERMQAVAIVATGAPGARQIAGLLAVDLTDRESPRFTLFQCARLIWATGGPAGLYADRVYPRSQTGATGLALEAGAPAQNLTEWQYGIASTQFRWNLSGTYQQVLPRYFSTDAEGGDEREFLQEWFDDAAALHRAVFLKGYQWPFDPGKLEAGGSSRVDLAVYRETKQRGRRVFIDYRHNPRGLAVPLTANAIGTEAHAYLARSGALAGTPIERLRQMNPDAIALYAANGIDLAAQPLEIAVCAQHCNGGLTGDIWWHSPLAGFYPIGEANGSFGIHRPGGSALNETQVGGRRAAHHIALQGPAELPGTEWFLAQAQPVVQQRLAAIAAMTQIASESADHLSPGLFRRRLQRRMSDCAGLVRDPDGLSAALAACRKELADPAWGQRLSHPGQIPLALGNYDLLLAQFACLSAMLDAAARGLGSRGSWLAPDPHGDCSCGGIRFRLAPPTAGAHIQVCALAGETSRSGTDPAAAAAAENTDVSGGYEARLEWLPVRPVPPANAWFETDWAAYRSQWALTPQV